MRKAISSLLLATLTLASCVYFEEPPASRAVVVGMDYYLWARKLNWCVADATSMIEALTMKNMEIVSILATNAPPVSQDRTDVLESLEDAVTEAPSGGWDLFLFYYSGHGDESLGIAFSSIGVNNNWNDQLTPEELFKAVAKIPARIRLVILDSCNSGVFVNEYSSISPYPADYTLGSEEFSFPFSFKVLSSAASAYSQGSSGDILVMSATGSKELSFESSSEGHGFFTSGLLKSQSEGDYNKDGLVSLTEAYYFARSYVVDTWNKQYTAEEWDQLKSTGYDDEPYMPRISGSPLDVTLFKVAQD